MFVFHKFIFNKMAPHVVLSFLNLHIISFSVLIMVGVQIKMHKTEFVFHFFVSVRPGLILWDEFRLRVFKNRLLKRIFGSERAKVTGAQKILCAAPCHILLV